VAQAEAPVSEVPSRVVLRAVAPALARAVVQVRVVVAPARVVVQA
jgi:hypothetical protein